MTGKAGKPEPDAIDLTVGARVRERRRALRMSQSALAKQLGVTLQQVKKYERGANRISGATLVRTASALGIGVSELVDQALDPPTADARELLDVVTKIEGKRERQAVLAKAKVIGHAPAASESVGRPAVFLDRDGTLNVERGYLHRPEDLELLPEAPIALRRLREAGYLLIVVTNQSAIARGLASEAEIERVNRRLVSELRKSGASLDAIYVCPHHPDASGDGVRADLAIVCNCRKPQLGMVERACREFGIDLARSWMVGDHTRDIETARRAGIRSILVKTGHAGLDGEWASKPDHVVEDLARAALLIASVDLELSDQSAQPISSS